MNPVLPFLIAAVATWAGGIASAVLVARLVRWVLAPQATKSLLGKQVVQAAAWTAVLFAVGFLAPKDLGREAPTGAWLPVVWPYAPFQGWMAVFGATFAVVCLVQAGTAALPTERIRRIVWATGWSLLALAGYWGLHASGSQIHILRGAVPVRWESIGLVAALSILTIAVIVATERQTRARGLARKVSTYIALFAGSIVFGIPFVWLLSTSFKEERDLGSPDGLVWVPQVQLTVPYDDPAHPLYLTEFEGRRVQAGLVAHATAGKLKLEVERPFGLRGRQFETLESNVTKSPRYQKVWDVPFGGRTVRAFTVEEFESGAKTVEVLEPAEFKGSKFKVELADLTPVRSPGLRWENYTDAIEWMPLETAFGLRYLVNTLWYVVMAVLGTVFSCSLVAYGFSRLRFPGRDGLFSVMLATMMLPAAVTMLPQFLIFRSLGWIDSLLPLWVPTFFAGAFNVFMLRQFFATVPMELEEAARIDGCGYLRTFWQVMLPQVKPALAVIAIWTFMGAWNNFMGPLIYVSSPEKVTLSYALQLFAGDRYTDVSLVMAFSTMTLLPVLLLFFFAQKYFIEGVTLSGLGGR